MNVYRITAPHFTAGAVSNEDGVIEHTAPIVKYMQGWPIDKVQKYCASKNWTFETVDCDSGTCGI